MRAMSRWAKKAAKTLRKSAPKVALRGALASSAGRGSSQRCSSAAAAKIAASSQKTQVQASTTLPWRSASQPAR